MKSSLTIVFLFLTSFLFAQQNMVPNYSFENYTSCPNGGSQLSVAYPWVAPTNNDADYFNVCSSNISSTVPQYYNGFNYYPKTGNAYSGIWVYNSPSANYREYLQVQLLSPLIQTSCYYVEYYVFFTKICRFSIKDISLNFSNVQVITTGNGLVLNLPKSISHFGNSYLNDTIHWVKISGIFIANGGEKYLTIGNFVSDLQTDTLNNVTGSYPGSYYFIDDVSVIPIDSLNLNAFAGNDTAIYIGDSVFIGQEISNLNCNWFVNGNIIASNVSGLFVKPTTTTTYVVEQNLCGIITYDTIMVQVNLVGISGHEKSNNYVQVFPNPTANNLTINWTMADISVFDIFDITGAKRMTIALENFSSSKSINLSKFDNGLYYYIIRDKNGNNIIFDKIIIQK